MHIKKLLDNGREKVKQLHKVISNRIECMQTVVIVCN